ncbi:MAG: aldo/keto reductase [Planctomycetota bacterium]|nr:aldo/keto reductase [Planctomycetota bacterium]
MHHRPLGTTGLLVSTLGLGTVKLGRTEGVKYPTPYDLPTDDEARALLALAADLGINLIDTAPAYGTSETRLGTLLPEFAGRFLLSTKVGEAFENGVSRFDFSPEHTRASIERSLQRLGRDALDIALVHADGNDLDIIQSQGTLDALADLRQSGKVRAIGFSPKTVAGARAALPVCDVLMLALNPRETEMLPVVREAHAAGVGVLVKKGLLSGHLDVLGKPKHDTDPPAAPPVDPVEACLGYLLAEPGVSSVIAGTINPEHLRQNAGAVARMLAR